LAHSQTTKTHPWHPLDRGSKVLFEESGNLYLRAREHITFIERGQAEKKRRTSSFVFFINNLLCLVKGVLVV
jgi:hypothetical protein